MESEKHGERDTWNVRNMESEKHGEAETILSNFYIALFP